jgi:hypothetical protein
MLRVYNTTTRKQEYYVYLKQRLNCVLFGKDSIWKENAENDFDLDVEDQGADYRDEDDEQSGDSASTSESSSGHEGGSNDDATQ